MHIFFVRNRLKLSGKLITCTQVSQSIDNNLVDYKSTKSVGVTPSQRLTPRTRGSVILVKIVNYSLVIVRVFSYCFR